jgi:hypothetical protein
MITAKRLLWHLHVGSEHPCSVIAHYLKQLKGDLEQFLDLDNMQ